MHLTKNGGVTDEVLQMINENAVSKPSFDDMQLLLLCTMRKTRYLQRRTQYGVSLDDYCQRTGCPIEDMSRFSAMDDPDEYNGKVNDLTSEYIIDLFKQQAEEHGEFMRNAFSNVPPSSVISLDHTFRVAKKTSEHVAAKEPEYLPAGTEGSSSYARDDKNTLLVAMGVDGKVWQCKWQCRGSHCQHCC